jgi:acetone carboxylase gamma subunit
VKYYKNNKDRVHERYIKNKDAKKAYDKEYREKNVEKIVERNTQIIECGCGQSYQRTHKAGHEKSDKHQTWIKTGQQKTFNRIIIQCECGGTYQDWTKNKHLKTQKHLNLLKLKD